MDAISEGLRKLILAGIGAVAATKEKSEVILDELVKKGELTVEQGKVLNEELKHNIKDAIRENVTLHVVTPEDNRGEADGDETDDTADFVLDAVDSLTDEQLSALKARIAEREKESSAGGRSVVAHRLLLPPQRRPARVGVRVEGSKKITRRGSSRAAYKRPCRFARHGRRFRVHPSAHIRPGSGAAPPARRRPEARSAAPFPAGRRIP